MTEKKILQCSDSPGDIRFSSLHAKVRVFRKFDTIENHYQLSKRFEMPNSERKVPIKNENGLITGYETVKDYYKPYNWREGRSKEADKARIGPYLLPPRFLDQWYKLLWLKYLDTKPATVKYASQFDDFEDNPYIEPVTRQADVIRQYIREGRQSIIHECQELLTLLRVYEMEMKDYETETGRSLRGLNHAAIQARLDQHRLQRLADKFAKEDYGQYL